MKLCPRCGKSIRKVERFCKFCGFYFPLLDIEKKQVVVIHTDIERFTRISHSFDLEDLDEILTNVFGSLIFLLENAGAFINQFYGDEIVSFLGLPGVKEDIIKNAFELQAKIHYFFENQKITEKLRPRIKISMEYGEVLITTQKTDGSIALSIFGEAEERAKQALKFVKGGETAVGINFLKNLNEEVKSYPATNIRDDIFIIGKG